MAILEKVSFEILSDFSMISSAQTIDFVSMPRICHHCRWIGQRSFR
jgi:hypothetical protein